MQLDKQHQKLIGRKGYNAEAGDVHREKQGKEKEGGCAALAVTSHELISAACEKCVRQSEHIIDGKWDGL